jgi:hypothetical protein
MKKYKIKVLDEMEIEEIKRVNREKLDFIMAQPPEYMISLAIKYYGESWMTCFAGNETYLHTEKLKHNNTHGSIRKKDGNRTRPILKIDAQTDEVIQSYDTVYECLEKEGFTNSQRSSLMAVLTGRFAKYQGFKWKFADEQKIVIYGQE